MVRRELSVQLDERLVETIDRAAATDQVAPDTLVEEALRRYFGLRGLAILADIDQSQQQHGIVPPADEQLLARAVAEVRTYRAERHSAAG